MTRPLQITVLSGTNRAGSRTLRVATALQGLYAALPGVSAQVLDLQRLPLEALSPDAYAQKPAALEPLTRAVLEADGLVVVSPEYNGGAPGALKLFIDLLPFPVAFERRPVCFVGLAAGRFGALRPIEQLQGVFGYRNALQYPDRVFISGAADALGDDGLPVDALARKLLLAQPEGFAAFCRAVAPLRPAQG